METWKRIALRAAGFGAGFAVAAAIILGVGAWWSNHLKPWNDKEITATYAHISTETTGDKNHIEFFFTLQNNTSKDYRVENGSNMHLAALLRKSDAMAFSNGKLLRTDYPIYVPAHSRAQIIFHLAYPYPYADDVEASGDVRHDFETKLARYATDKLGNLEGFVLMDDVARYRIEMKEGWSERAKETLRVKIPEAGK